MTRITALIAGLLLAFHVLAANAAIIFDNFNVDEGRFGLDPNFSSGSLNDAASSTADRVTTDSPLEGAGHQKLVFNWEDLPEVSDPGANIRIRHLSGGGSPAGASGQPANTSFTVGAGTDGWIGFYLKTTTAGWTTQLWIEGAENNGGVPKNVIADGQWHLYEWNLDDETGGANGWGPVTGIVGGDADVQAGSYTIDSIIFRDGTTASTTMFLDYVAKSDSGSIAGLLNSPPTVGDLNIGQVLRNVGTQNLGPLPSSDPEMGTLTWSIDSIVAPGPFDMGDFVVDPVTGLLDFNSVQEELGAYQVTLKATDPGGLSDTGVLTFEVIIPEPASFTLLGLAMVGALGLIRRR